jgi:antirestriction protein ArdC
MLCNCTEDARGFRQWEEAGRHVKKGERAFSILGPRIVADAQRREAGDADATKLIGFRRISVFALEQTEGESIEAPNYAPVQAPHFAEVAHALGIDIGYMAFNGQPWAGCFIPRRNAIRLATHDESVFFHELAHAVDNKITGPLKIKQDAVQEAVAELAASALSLMALGVDRTANLAAYIKAYSADPAALLLKVMSRTQAVLDYIITESAKTTQAQAA